MKTKLLKHKNLTICVMIGVLALSSAAQAVPVSVDMTPADFDNLLGGLSSAVVSPMVSSITSGNLSAEVTSQPFSDGTGNYLYLYQIRNTGGAAITRFTGSPYMGADSGITLGYLTANIPDNFSAGDQAPLYGDVDADSGPTVGFNFPVGFPLYGIPDSYIGVGNSSFVMYVESALAPGVVTGNVIDGMVGSVSIYGPVPEPATIGLLALGSMAWLGRRKKT